MWSQQFDCERKRMTTGSGCGYSLFSQLWILHIKIVEQNITRERNYLLGTLFFRRFFYLRLAFKHTTHNDAM